ncbi:transporter [Corynebacterium glucuronolyticum]|uniref:transporter n=1 Tax=Corynebacterium glucuronolyticum TaxID=39791 RepID=UPI001EF2482E|nr:transporter [Corynebacterium glucuronolyticum]
MGDREGAAGIDCEARAVNPLSVASLAATAWIVVLGTNRWWLSVLVAIVAASVGRAWGKTLLVTLPMALSLLVIHAPHGQTPIAPLVTVEGVVATGALTARFAACVASVFAVARYVRVEEMVKAIQQAGSPRLAYLVGSAFAVLPEGKRALAEVREAAELGGMKAPKRTVVTAVITLLLVRATERTTALTHLAIDRPGPRTMYAPVPPRAWWTLPLPAVALIAVVVKGAIG